MKGGTRAGMVSDEFRQMVGRATYGRNRSRGECLRGVFRRGGEVEGLFCDRVQVAEGNTTSYVSIYFAIVRPC